MKRRSKDPTRREVAAWSAFVAASMRGQTTPDELEQIMGAAPRARRVQREGAEQEALTRLARREWWAPGYRHHEQARPTSDVERMRLSRRGVVAGWPDVTLHVPERVIATKPHVCGWPDGPGGWSWSGSAQLWICRMPRTLAALELKAGRNRASEAQRWTLALLESVGYRVHVAHGHEDAIAWLREVAGPEPVEPVAWPKREGEVDDWK